MTRRSPGFRALRQRVTGAVAPVFWLLLVLVLLMAAALYWRSASGPAAEAARPVIDAFPLRIVDPRIRQPLPGTSRTAGYLSLENRGPDELVLIAVESPLLPRIEIHETLQIEDRVRMERLETLTIPSGGAVNLQPGGKHLMVFGVSGQLPPEVPITLTFLSGKTQQISFRSYGITES